MKKRIFTLFLLLTAVVGLFPAAMAAGTEQITVRFYDEVSQRYSEPTVTDRVNLTLDGEALIPEDVPALAYYPEGSTNGRTLVPVRLISEALDATVTWVPETRQIIILREESTIVLTAGSATALVDGQAVELPDGVPAGGVMWDGKESTMVPLRFVSEQLGSPALAAISRCRASIFSGAPASWTIRVCSPASIHWRMCRTIIPPEE